VSENRQLEERRNYIVSSGENRKPQGDYRSEWTVRRANQNNLCEIYRRSYLGENGEKPSDKGGGEALSGEGSREWNQAYKRERDQAKT